MEILNIAYGRLYFIDFITIMSFFVAVIIAIGYFFRPFVRLSEPSLDKDELFKVKLKNHNLRNIPEIKCEIATSETNDFNNVSTEDVDKKDTIMFLNRHPNFYIFKSHLKHKKPFVRIRLLAHNFLGVKRTYETIYLVDRTNQEHYTLTIQSKKGYRLI